MVVSRSWEREEWSVTTNKYLGFFFLEQWKFPELNYGDGCTLKVQILLCENWKRKKRKGSVSHVKYSMFALDTPMWSVISCPNLLLSSLASIGFGLSTYSHEGSCHLLMEDTMWIHVIRYTISCPGKMCLFLLETMKKFQLSKPRVCEIFLVGANFLLGSYPSIFHEPGWPSQASGVKLSDTLSSSLSRWHRIPQLLFLIWWAHSYQV